MGRTAQVGVVAAVALVGMLCPLAGAVLPPGFEDVAWCPPRSCLRPAELEPGFTGSRSSFVECYDADSGKVVDEIWTGSKNPAVVPKGWTEATYCNDGTSTVEEPEPCMGLVSWATASCA